MHYLSNFFEDRIKRDLFYRYSYINSDQIPKILKVTLDINLIKKKYKHLTSLLLALEILSMKGFRILGLAYKEININAENEQQGGVPHDHGGTTYKETKKTEHCEC